MTEVLHTSDESPPNDASLRFDGRNPKAWNDLVTSRGASGTTNKELIEILCDAVQTVTLPTTRQTQEYKTEYGLMWVKVSTLLRAESTASAILEGWSNLPNLRRNAYLYTTWAHVEKSRYTLDYSLLIICQESGYLLLKV